MKKRILITGAHGFLGRYTARRFKEEGHYITGMGHGKWDPDEYNQWGLDEWFETTITFEALLNINEQFDIIVNHQYQKRNECSRLDLINYEI